MNQILITKQNRSERLEMLKTGQREPIFAIHFMTVLIILVFLILLFTVVNNIGRKNSNPSIAKIENPKGEAMIDEELIQVVLNAEAAEEAIAVIPKKNKEIEEMKAGEVLDKSLIQEEKIEEYFCSYEIENETYARIEGKSYPSNAKISLENLRYIKLLHNGFDGKVYVGELIVNASIADDILDIFKTLYKKGYQIEKMKLVDEYEASDEQSMEDNNTSAFNYRNVGITSKLSKHAYGFAIDINPKQNPYVYADGTCEPASSKDYANRNNSDLEHMIGPGDLCYELFIAHGFSWGGNWKGNKDYQHFYKIK